MGGEWDLAVCGLNCAVCDMMHAGEGDEAKRREIVQWFRDELNKEVKPEDVRCTGCRGDLYTHWSPDCRMMLCARERGHDHCYQCGDFVCDKLEAFAGDGLDHHRRTVENMKRIKEMGLEAWVEEQRKKGPAVFCP